MAKRAVTYHLMMLFIISARALSKKEEVPIIPEEPVAKMTIQSPLKIGELNNIEIEMADNYMYGIIRQCYVLNVGDDVNAMEKAYVIYERCGPSLISIEEEEFKDHKIRGKLKGVGLPGTDRIQIVCKAAGYTAVEYRDEFRNAYPC